MKLSVSKDYWLALEVSLIFQIGFGILAAVATDGGMLLRFWSFAMAAYWGNLLYMVLVRPNAPTRLDLFLIRWGSVFLLGLAPFVSSRVWRLLGVV